MEEEANVLVVDEETKKDLKEIQSKGTVMGDNGAANQSKCFSHYNIPHATKANCMQYKTSTLRAGWLAKHLVHLVLRPTVAVVAVRNDRSESLDAQMWMSRRLVHA